MTSYSAKILNNAISGLQASQAQIAVTGNNIANVNTPGYTRRVVDLQTRVIRSSLSGLEIGDGVDAAQVRQVTDGFIDGILRDAGAKKGTNEISSDFLNRVQNLFSVQGNVETIGSNLEAFFNAAHDLTLNPSSIDLRGALIARGQELVTTISSSFRTISSLQREADTRVGQEITTINSLASQIASLNAGVIRSSSGSQNAVDQLDQRSQALQKLSEKIGFKAVEQSDGTVQVTLANGFALVSGTEARTLSVTTSPSFASGPVPAGLDGGPLSYIVYDYSGGAGTGQIDLTRGIQQGEGSLAGLLRVRGYAPTSATNAFAADGPLVQLASRIEGIARNLLTSVNETYRGPDRDTTSSADRLVPSSGDLNGNSPGVFGLFTFPVGSSVPNRDVNDNGIADQSDLDSLGLTSYASVLQFGVTDPRAVAAARDATSPFPPTPPPPPAVYNSGDGRNMEALGALRTATYTFSAGSYSLDGTFSDAYNETVSYVGSQVRRAQQEQTLADAQFQTAQGKRDAVSGVSLDEEFTTLLQAQKAFQGSARMIKVGQDILDSILQLI